jgi:hypothetical protein
MSILISTGVGSAVKEMEGTVILYYKEQWQYFWYDGTRDNREKCLVKVTGLWDSL